MATLRQIAHAAKLSISVVSRVLNPKPDKNARVAPATRVRVLHCARALGYRPNRAAEFLKRGKMPSLGVFLPPIANRLLADLIFGLAETAAAHDFPLSFSFSLTPKEYQRYIESVAGDYAHCGIISYPNFWLDKKIVRVVESFRQQGGKLVLLNAHVALPGLTVIDMDEYEGGRLAAQRLLSRGCAEYLNLGLFKLRNQGFSETLAAAGASCQLLPADDESLEKIARRCTHYSAAAPLGVFAVTDLDAMRVMRALHDKPVKIGREVCLVGYDDLYTTHALSPALTTIHQPFREMGRVAVKKCVNLIYGQTEAPQKIKPYLVGRESA